MQLTTIKSNKIHSKDYPVSVCVINSFTYLQIYLLAYLLTCVANVCLSDQVPLDCLAEDPSTVPAAAAGDAVYRCAKCRLHTTQYNSSRTSLASRRSKVKVKLFYACLCVNNNSRTKARFPLPELTARVDG